MTTWPKNVLNCDVVTWFCNNKAKISIPKIGSGWRKGRNMMQVLTAEQPLLYKYTNKKMHRYKNIQIQKIQIQKTQKYTEIQK